MNDVNRPSLNTPQRVHCPYIGFDYKLQFICSESVYHGRIMSSLSCRHLTIRAKRAIPMTKTLFIIERKNYLYIYIYIFMCICHTRAEEGCHTSLYNQPHAMFSFEMCSYFLTCRHNGFYVSTGKRTIPKINK